MLLERHAGLEIFGIDNLMRPDRKRTAPGCANWA